MTGTDDTETALLQRLRATLEHASANAPSVAAVLARAKVAPRDIDSLADLVRIPVTSKQDLRRLQGEHPPFGGFLAVPADRLARIFVSPGPVYDPQIRDDDDNGLGYAFASSGFGRGDIVLNTWSYHLVPAGIILDEALRAAGATVIPGGTGNTEAQAKLVLDLGVTGICASTAFFQAIADKIEDLGTPLPAGWRVKRALLGGEFGDWTAKRRALERRYAMATFSLYATGDVGIVAFERDGTEGYTVTPSRIVQICDPASGACALPGESGEIVVTVLSRGYPLIRFGTGDLSRALEVTRCGGAALRIAPLSGRVAPGVKAREIFIYPHQVTELLRRVPSLRRAQVVVSRPAAREEVSLRVEADGPEGGNALVDVVGAAFAAITRLRADRVSILASGTLSADAPSVVDRKDSATG